jgi:NDP-sugar pyrophosphorylase family protein
MRTLLLADRVGRELLPLTDCTCPALLPVAGKAVIEHSVEMLAEAGIKQATVVVGSFSEQVRALLDDGKRWGMQLDYWHTRGEEQPAAVLAQLQVDVSEALLLVRGDILRTPCLAEFLQAAVQQDAPLLQGLLQGQAAGLGYCRAASADLKLLHWPILAEAPSLLDAEFVVELGEGAVARLESLAAFHQASLDAIAGRIPRLRVAGRQTALGLTQGRNSKVSPRSLKVGMAFVGDHSQIHATASLSGEVAVCDHVIIDSQTRLADTVILPNTYVGELVDLRNAIVRGNDLIRVDTGTHLRLADTFLLADLRQVSVGHSLAPVLHRLIGFLLLVLSLPLWPLAALAAYVEHPPALLRARQLRGNRIELGAFGERRRAEFTAWEWATRRPVLRSLPRLLAVVMGDLRLVGVEPVSQEQADRRVQEWERLADQAPAGLFGPTQLRIPDGVPEEERLLSDAFFASQPGSAKLWQCLAEAASALFSRRAWSLES